MITSLRQDANATLHLGEPLLECAESVKLLKKNEFNGSVCGWFKTDLTSEIHAIPAKYVDRYRTSEWLNPVYLVGASSIISSSDGKVLIGIRKDDKEGELIGGYTEPGESPTECVIREIEEESGLSDLTNMQMLGLYVNESNRTITFLHKCKVALTSDEMLEAANSHYDQHDDEHSEFRLLTSDGSEMQKPLITVLDFFGFTGKKKTELLSAPASYSL